MASPDINQKESILIKEFLAGHPGGKQIIRATTQSGLKLNSHAHRARIHEFVQITDQCPNPRRRASQFEIDHVIS